MRGLAAPTAKALATATQGAVVLFGLLYIVAARLYPGGTRSNRYTTGFSLRDNFWCDLLDDTAYGGLPNRGRPVAVGAMLILCVGLAALWWSAPTLFGTGARRASTWSVRGAGVASCLIIPLVATKHHDRVIHIAGLLATLAFVQTARALPRRIPSLRALTAIAFGLSVATWAIWQTRIGISWLAVVQKAAFFFFLAWAFRLAAAVREAP